MSVEENLLAILETLISVKKNDEFGCGVVDRFEHQPSGQEQGGSAFGWRAAPREISRALVTQPNFILLDEPFAGIDPIAVLDIQGIIRSLKAKGIGVLMSDHNVRETLKVCEWAYIMHEGKILEEGQPALLAESDLARRTYLGDQFSL